MRNPTYLARTKAGIFYLRWPIPRSLHPLNRISFLKLSLSTHEPGKALRLARLLIHIGEQINEQGIVRNMRFDEVLGALRKHFKEMLEKEKGRIDATGRLSGVQIKDYELKLSNTQKAIEDNSPWLGEADDTKIIKAFISKHGLSIESETEQYEWLRGQMRRAYRSYIGEVLKYDQSFDDFDLGSAQLQNDRADEQIKSTAASISLEQVLQRFLKERDAGNVWAERTKMEKRDHAALLMDIIPKDTDIASVSALDAASVKDALMTVPKNWRKLPQCKGLKIADVVKAKDLPRLQPASINKYLQTYSDLFSWATSNGYIDKNIFQGLGLKYDKRRTEKERSGFTDRQVKIILTHTVDNALTNVRKDYQKWGPIIAAYTGARLNEIAQIELADIKQESGIWYFNISDLGDDQSVKTTASKRKLPVHSQLLSYGLLSFADELRARGKKHLFHELSYSVEHGRGRNLGRWFNEKLLPELGMDDPIYVFHSFRHTVNAKLVGLGVSDHLIKAIMGHQQQGMTYSVYLKQGFKLPQLSEALETLSYGP